jgi:hypothetical protein
MLEDIDQQEFDFLATKKIKDDLSSLSDSSAGLTGRIPRSAGRLDDQEDKG